MCLTTIASPALADVGAGSGNLSAYLHARVADGDGQVDIAARGYAQALAGAPDNPAIADRAYREAMAAGDLALARRAAAVLNKTGVAPSDAAFLALADAAQANDPIRARTALSRLKQGPLAVLIPALNAWIALAADDAKTPPLEKTTDTAIARRFTAETRVQLLVAAGQVDAGLAALEALGGLRAPVDLRIAVAQLLMGQGHTDRAAAIMPGDDPVLVALRSGAGVKPSLAFGLSRMLTRVAADLATGEPGALSIALTRAALVAEPGNDRARLLLADALSRDGAPDHALTVLGAIDQRGAYASAARSFRITTLAAAGRAETALAEARTLAEGDTAGPDDWQRYADLLTTAHRPADAAKWYGKLTKAPETADSWAAWLQYGGALDEAGQWVRAEPALARAVTLAPAEPLTLNYLGYARIIRGEDVAESARLLERARALKPDDPSITDSLGWAYHLTGDTVRALPLLERAAAAAPTNAEISEHLGDAYWTLGRRYDARYAWSAAAVVAEDVVDARLAGKIAKGLPPR